MISVIVPVYNVEAYLGKCLNSIIAQTYTDLEILLVDDGSTDRCGEICDQYAKLDHRIRVFHTENHGLSVARNVGLDHALGQYIGFVDSDDWIEPNMYETLFHLTEQTNADITTCRFYYEYQNKTLESLGPRKQLMFEGDDVLRTYIFDQSICQDSWNNLFKAELFQNVRYPEGRNFEDYFIKPPLLQKAKRMVYTPSCLLHYRNRQNSLSNIHTLKNNVDFWLVFRERFDMLSSMSDEYYRMSVEQAIAAIGRMWRWYASYSGKEKQQAKMWLDEMQRFSDLHFNEIVRGTTYSRGAKITCILAKSKNPLLFRGLYWATQIYRNHKIRDQKYFP
jgi:glycosyltransferase involved in cell wall biosynthesis